MPHLVIQPCLDSEEHGNRCREMLAIPRMQAAELGASAVQASEDGVYPTENGLAVHWRHLVATACAKKLSIPPDQTLPKSQRAPIDSQIPIANQTALEATREIVNQGQKILSLNFANGINPGGGFLHGARAQEEVLCRSSAPYLTLWCDPVYTSHRKHPLPDSTDWAILSRMYRFPV
jgi:uncharacterized protein (TIGR02452 family)